MARAKVKPRKPARTQGSGGKPSRGKGAPRRKSRKGHSRTSGGKPRSPSLR